MNNNNILYWTSEGYGRGKHYRKYALFPNFLPLNIYSQHGIYHSDKPAKHEIENCAPFTLYFTKDLVINHNKVPNINSHAIHVLDPFVYFRKRYKIKPSPSAMGTLFFVAHSTPESNVVFDDDQLLICLKEFNKEMLPVTLCFHNHDIVKGRQLLYEEHGYQIISMGLPLDKNYIENFYNTLIKYRFTSSNHIGSYVYYSIDLGIPFKYIQQEVVFWNISDKNYEINKEISNGSDLKEVSRKLFCSESDVPTITDSQKKFVSVQVGEDSKMRRMYFVYIVYLALIYHLFKNLNNRIRRLF